MPCLPMRRSGSLVVRAASSTGSSLSQPSRPSGRVSSERILRCLTADGGGTGSADLAGVLRVLIGYAGYGSRIKSTKNPPTFIRRRKVPWRLFVREIALPHIDPFGSRHLAVSNGRLPDPVSRITPDA